MKKYILGLALVASLLITNSVAHAQAQAPNDICRFMSILTAIFNLTPDQVQTLNTVFHCTSETNPTTGQEIRIVGQPTLALNYDSAHNEAGLIATFRVDVVNNSNQAIYLYKQQTPIGLVNDSDSHNGAAILGNQLWADAPSTNPGDTNDSWFVPVGTTRSFTLQESFNPNTMFAGVYRAYLDHLVKNCQGSCSDRGFVSGTGVYSNSLTVIGERAPYITSTDILGCGVGQDKCYFTINGVRFASSGNIINVQDGTGSSIPVRTPYLEESVSRIRVNLGGNMSGFYVLQVTNPATGASNLVGFKVGNTQTGQASIYTTIDSNTPLTRTVSTSASAVTPDVVLGVFDLKSQNNSSTLNGLPFSLPGSNASVLQNIRLCAPGAACVGANSLNGEIAPFSNLTISLPQDQWVPLTLKTDVPAGVNNFTTHASLMANSISAVDSSFNRADISNAANVTANDVTFQSGTATPPPPPPPSPLSYTVTTSSGSSDSNGHWNSGGVVPQWIELHLNNVSTVTKLRLLTNQTPAGQTTHQIYAGANSNPSQLVRTLSGNTSSGQWLESSFSPPLSNVSYIRVLTTDSPSWVAWNGIEVDGVPSTSTAQLTLGNQLANIFGAIQSVLSRFGH